MHQCPNLKTKPIHQQTPKPGSVRSTPPLEYDGGHDLAPKHMAMPMGEEEVTTAATTPRPGFQSSMSRPSLTTSIEYFP